VVVMRNVARTIALVKLNFMVNLENDRMWVN
jgi:hypothetical protein